MADALLSAFLQVLFDRLASKEVLDFVRGHDIEKDLKKLKKTLKYIEAFLNHAESKQLTNKTVKDWVDELKDAAYDAEDVLDDVAYEALRRTMEAESSQGIPMELWSSVSAFLNLSNDGIESKIKSINERFDDLAEERFKLGLEEIAAGTPSSSINEGRETSSVIGETPIYGRDYDKEKIMELVLKPDDKFSVISIVAMGGIGKTTLAQDVYNDDTVKGHFDLKAWVCVSDDFNAKRITKDILSNFTSKPSDSDSLDLLQVKLKEAFSGKKFLIILDDVWSKDYTVWDVLQKPLTAGAAGSKVLVTTREKEVASMMGTAEYHYLKHLSDDDCWSVFVRHAFVNRDIDAMPKLVEIGKKIVKKCKGLPLAAKMLGVLLRSKPEEDEWEDILNSEIWDPETVGGIFPELR